MFSKTDYLNYLSELENILKESVIIYTDLLNDVPDREIYNKLFTLARENMDDFNDIQKIKEKFV